MKRFKISSLLVGTFLVPVVSYGSADFGGTDGQFAGVVVSDAALFEAIKAQNINLVNYLLDHGANVNARMKEVEYSWGNYPFKHYLSPLVVAIRTRNIDMVRLLLGRGANVNTEGGSVNVPLYEAVRSCPDNIVRLLLEQKGIDINVRQNVNMSWDDYERGEDPHQVPETALGYINKVGIGSGPKAGECYETVRLMLAKGARSR
ncbi:MAG: ankyrin repeat domain-containing protein [Puniceicoccales bacterium]|jgi:ankyrin repeat protein|nr:ankyrin repeat domain-containing protein [Puniceicoccales bacterium]